MRVIVRDWDGCLRLNPWIAVIGGAMFGAAMWYAIIWAVMAVWPDRLVP